MTENNRPAPKPGPGLFPKGSGQGAPSYLIEGPHTKVKPSGVHGEGVNSLNTDEGLDTEWWGEDSNWPRAETGDSKPHEDLMQKIDRVDAYLTDLTDEVQEDEEIGSQKGADGVTDGVGTEFWDRLNRGEAPEPQTLEEAKAVIAYKDQCIERAHSRWSDEMDERYRYQGLFNQSMNREQNLHRMLKAQGDLLEAKDRRIDLYKRIADSRKKACEVAWELLELRELI